MESLPWEQSYCFMACKPISKDVWRTQVSPDVLFVNCGYGTAIALFLFSELSDSNICSSPARQVYNTGHKSKSIAG